MKMINLKKIMSLVLVFALIIGGINLGARKVSAEEEISTEETENTEKNLITGQEGHALNDYAVPAVQFSFDRETVNNLNNKNGEVNIILVVDASNSMVNNKINNQTRLALAKKEACDFVDAISATKNLTAKFFVYSFNQNVADKLPGGSSDAATVKNAINGITASQGTNISKGLYEALDDVTDKDSTIMVLLSDGEATYATTADGSTTYGPTFGFGVSDDTKNNVKAETKTALQAAVAGVADIYAISIFETDAAVKEVITKTLNVVNGAELATQFGAIAEEIKKNATGAKLIAEVGKYVAFSRAVDANGNEVSSVKPGLAEDGKTRIFTWDIPSPESLEVSGTEEDITSPIVEFTITATADELIEAWKNGDEQVSAEIVKDDDGNTFANITLWLTAKTTLSYTQYIEDTTQSIKETKTVNLEVQSFITKVAAITEVPVSDVLTVNYFVDNNEKPVASVSVEVPYGYEL
ncbi:MAG: VWA domain-containing protein, partial [Lachnospiraceae bacterium]|nr:VWA domain-containing protein [Lachnospiraceae bacterium]